MEQLNMGRQKKFIHRVNEKYIFADFKDFSKITDDVRKINAKRPFTGGVRINNGMYRTHEETDAYISKSLMRKLP